jgi:hypothetical protein
VFVVEARLELDEGCDPAAVGAAVTVALCGHCQHEGPCRWPHNNAVDEASKPARFRTVVVAPGDEEAHVRQRIEAALGFGSGWDVVSTTARPIARGERALARRLLTTRRANDDPPGSGPI